MTASQVLVVYNSRSADGQTVLNAYLAAHPDLPAANVFDLNSAAMAGRADVTYAEFIADIRNPIRAYLDQLGDPAPEGIVSLCLIRGIPHRIQDTDYPTVGDNPLAQSNEFGAGDATSASVDSELVLLWQNLETDEAGLSMDSKSDSVIDNPYHGLLTSIQGHPRTSIKTAKTFGKSSGSWSCVWTNPQSDSNRLTPGGMYLVSRIDGTSAADALAMIDRARDLRVNRKYVFIILDKDGVNGYDSSDPYGLFGGFADYDVAHMDLTAAGWRVIFDYTGAFIQATAFTRPVIAYASYGENHSPMPSNPSTYIEGFDFVPGAMFNTVESYNGRALNGLGTMFNQEQVADFVHAGGTFGIGHVWEPFTFTLPDNDYLLRAMLVEGLTWGEAAWSSIPCLSWAHVVLGDPLARVIQVVNQPADFDADLDVDDADTQFLRDCITGPGVGPVVGTCREADLNGDGRVDMSDSAAIQRCISASYATLFAGCAN